MCGCVLTTERAMHVQHADHDRPGSFPRLCSSGGRLQLVPLLCVLLAAVTPRAKGATTPTGEECGAACFSP